MFLCTCTPSTSSASAPAAAGLLFPPFNLAVVAGSLAGPRVAAAARRARAPWPAGCSRVAAGALALRAIAPGAPALPSLLGGFVLLGAGLGVASVASTARGTAALGAADQGLASGLLATSAQLGHRARAWRSSSRSPPRTPRRLAAARPRRSPASSSASTLAAALAAAAAGVTATAHLRASQGHRRRTHPNANHAARIQPRSHA